MLIVISPAKNLDFESPAKTKITSQPAMLKEAKSLVDICKKFSAPELTDLMGISNKLAFLNAERFQEWSPPFNDENSKQALLAFNGDVYSGLNATSFTESDLKFAQDHLRILSGLYGILRPLDLMQAYRLEMGTKLKTPKGDNLYKYWGSLISEKLNEVLKESKDDILINLASDEYFKSIDLNALDVTIVRPIFKDQKNGKYKVISFFAKKARGMMARFIIKNRLNDPKDLENFNAEGYQFCKEDSLPLNPVFHRREIN
ncbi:MAG: peroxide stress protein YaaA [SAR324 cluster bacterium]|jgi:hypothetical protein|nr:peroxide stress protein YaaA [Deltaproteobacteria bacterium]MDP6092999.1 peroxide stress protein YaaA [SAR324 cluster bacterium]MDP6247261.1 peroxide stress protein YaaA [SAR324 cluster bacterium]MDP6463116.1 peroxide stress protein YaaA [SAR324 cluster bacterium]MDP6638022.1 peroxide stress protein YaaA [SAR324 cluster bacterium]|tara:strand:- start:2870 stop:3646 length:777 start_codon:yes stop_codon:yes gene_type:complete